MSMFFLIDNNECWNPCACPAGQKCHNLVGSYECKLEGNYANTKCSDKKVHYYHISFIIYFKSLQLDKVTFSKSNLAKFSNITSTINP